jgi:alpha-beta hydrolase superfamily lysophospholipase
LYYGPVTAASPPTSVPVREEEGRTPSADGLALYWRSWTPESPRMALLFLHGLAEHAGRYLNPARYFAPRGYACYAFDYRGHGRSPGPRVHVDQFDEFVGDLRSVEAFVRSRHPQLPLVVVGHSHGALVAMCAALGEPPSERPVILTSPFLAPHPDLVPSGMLRLAGRVLRRLAPRLLIHNHVPAERVSRDPAVVAAYAGDPLVSHTVSSGWYAALVRAQADVFARAPEWRAPALVMAGGADRLVDVAATQRFAARVPDGRLELIVWEGLYHEIFNEPEKEQVFKKMEDWLKARA